MILPVLGIGAVSLVFLIRLSRDRPGMPLDEVAGYFVPAVACYGIIPLLGLALGDPRASSTDWRMYGSSTSDLVVHGFRHLVYLASFCVVYLWMRRRLRSPEVRGGLVLTDRHLPAIACLLLFTLQGILTYYSITFDIGGETYWEQNQRMALVAERMPLLLSQGFAHLGPIILVAKFFLLVVLFSNYKKRWPIIWLWIAAELLITVEGLGARRPLVFLLLASLFLYHRFVRPVKVAHALLIGLIGLPGFLLFGYIRSANSLPFGPQELLTSPSEFQTLFFTGFDLFQRRLSDTLPPIPVQLYFADFLALIPSQFLPFTKWSGGEWYLELLQLRGLGVGFGFGVMAEAAIGFGWIDLIARAAILGAIFARLHRWYATRSDRIWPTVLYVWLCAYSLLCFRASTFVLLRNFFLEFLPLYLVVMIASGARETLWSKAEKPGMPRLSPTRSAS